MAWGRRRPTMTAEFIILRHRCVRCLEVSEVAVPPIVGLARSRFRRWRGCVRSVARCPRRMTRSSARISARRRGTRPAVCLRNRLRWRGRRVRRGPRCSRRCWPASSVLIADESGRMRPAPRCWPKTPPGPPWLRRPWTLEITSTSRTGTGPSRPAAAAMASWGRSTAGDG